MKSISTISLLVCLWISGCATSPYKNETLSKPMRLHEMLADQGLSRAQSLAGMGESQEAHREVFDIIKRYPRTKSAERAVMLVMDWNLERGEIQAAFDFGWDFLVKHPGSRYTELLRTQLNRLKKDLNRFDKPQDSNVWEGVHTVNIKDSFLESTEDVLQPIELKRPPQSEAAAASVQLLSGGSASYLDPHAIGVLLPLSGKYAAYGKKALTAIRLGLGLKDFSVPTEPHFEEVGDTFRVIFADTGGDPIKAAEATNHLISQYGVIALLGDLLQDTSVVIAERANAYGVPLIALSRKENLTLIGPWVFRLGLTVDKQVRGLLEYAMFGQNLNEFAILYPRHAYGQEMAESFVRHASHLKADIAFVKSYDPAQTTFTDLAKSVTGRDALKTNDQYKLCVDEANLIENKRSARWHRRQCTKVVPPEIPYSGLFIPDFPKTISYLVPALVASDLLVSQDPNIQRIYKVSTSFDSIKPVQLLGSATWNNPMVAKRLGKQVNGATFVDGFDVNSETADVQKFVANYASIMSIKPELIEAQAYDAARIFSFLLNQSSGYRPQTREALKESLVQLESFPGVVGPIRFDSHGDSMLPLFRFELDNSIIKLASDQPNSKDS